MRYLFCTFSHFFHCYRTLSAIAVVVFLSASLYADTTWVAGDVYDVCDTTGSPFEDGVVPIGWHIVVWDAGDNPSGIYFCRMDGK